MLKPLHKTDDQGCFASATRNDIADNDDRHGKLHGFEKTTAVKQPAREDEQPVQN